MMRAARWHIVVPDGEDGVMVVESEDGPWVSYADYARLVQIIERVRGALAATPEGRVERHDPAIDIDGYPAMFIVDEGSWVRHGDHAKVTRERDALARQVAAARDHADRTRASYRDDPGPECCAGTATVLADMLTDAIDAAVGRWPVSEVDMRAARGTAVVLAEDDTWRPGDRAVRNMAMALLQVTREHDALLAEVVVITSFFPDDGPSDRHRRRWEEQRAVHRLAAVTRDRDRSEEMRGLCLLEIDRLRRIIADAVARGAITQDLVAAAAPEGDADR